MEGGNWDNCVLCCVGNVLVGGPVVPGEDPGPDLKCSVL